MRRLAREHPGRTRRTIGAIASRARHVRDARNALREAEVHAVHMMVGQLAEWRQSEPERFEEALSGKFGSTQDLLQAYWAQIERLEKAVRKQVSWSDTRTAPRKV
jgi:hypothetical protein